MESQKMISEQQQQQQRICKKKRSRTVFTSDQLMELEKEFKSSEFLSRSTRYLISQRLNLNERQIKIWFQNRRMKDKNDKKKKFGTKNRYEKHQSTAITSSDNSNDAYSEPMQTQTTQVQLTSTSPPLSLYQQSSPPPQPPQMQFQEQQSQPRLQSPQAQVQYQQQQQRSPQGQPQVQYRQQQSPQAQVQYQQQQQQQQQLVRPQPYHQQPQSQPQQPTTLGAYFSSFQPKQSYSEHNLTTSYGGVHQQMTNKETSPVQQRPYLANGFSACASTDVFDNHSSIFEEESRLNSHGNFNQFYDFSTAAAAVQQQPQQHSPQHQQQTQQPQQQHSPPQQQQQQPQQYSIQQFLQPQHLQQLEHLKQLQYSIQQFDQPQQQQQYSHRYDQLNLPEPQNYDDEYNYIVSFCDAVTRLDHLENLGDDYNRQITNVLTQL